MKPTHWETRVIASVVVVGFILLTVLIVLHGFDVAIKEVVLVLVGILAAKFGTVVDYYMGSSSGSARKDEILGGKK